MDIKYVGDLGGVKIVLNDGGYIKVKRNKIFKVSNADGERLLSTKNFISVSPKKEKNETPKSSGSIVKPEKKDKKSKKSKEIEQPEIGIKEEKKEENRR